MTFRDFEERMKDLPDTWKDVPLQVGDFENVTNVITVTKTEASIVIEIEGELK